MIAGDFEAFLQNRGHEYDDQRCTNAAAFEITTTDRFVQFVT